MNWRGELPRTSEFSRRVAAHGPDWLSNLVGKPSAQHTQAILTKNNQPTQAKLPKNTQSGNRQISITPNSFATGAAVTGLGAIALSKYLRDRKRVKELEARRKNDNSRQVQVNFDY